MSKKYPVLWFRRQKPYYDHPRYHYSVCSVYDGVVLGVVSPSGFQPSAGVFDGRCISVERLELLARFAGKLRRTKRCVTN